MNTTQILTFGTLLLVLVMASACKVLLPAHANSMRTEGEVITLRLMPDVPGVEAIDPGVLLPAIDFLLARTNALIDAEKDLYTSSYGGSVAVGDLWGAEGLTYRRLLLTRDVGVTADAKGEHAVTIELALDGTSATSGVVLVRPASVLVRKARAKVLPARWYLPWTLFYNTGNTVDLTVEIKVTRSYTEGDEKKSSTSTANLTFPSCNLDAPVLKHALQPTEMLTVGGKGTSDAWRIDVTVTEKDPRQAVRDVKPEKDLAKAIADEIKKKLDEK